MNTYPRQIAQVGSLRISAQNEIYDNLPKALKEALFTTAKLVWAEDTDCDEANGQQFKDAHQEAEALLESYGLSHIYA